MPFLKNFKLLQFKRQEKEKKEQRTFRNGLRHEIYEPNVDKYKGEWLSNKKNGKGQFLSTCGYYYKGNWVNDLRWGHGIGALITKDKKFDQIYIGDWNENMKHGEGRLRYKDGSLYDGEFYLNERNGIGSQWYSTGEYYEGEWAHDKRCGVGILVQANGNRYEGEWKCDLKHGEGIFLNLDNGQIQRGIWVCGICKASQIFEIYWRQSAEEPTIYPLKKICVSDELYELRREYFLKQNEKKVLVCPKKEKEKIEKIEIEKLPWIPCYIKIKKSIPSPYF